MKVYLDDDYVGAEDACISIHDRGFLYGDALYENVRVHRGGFFRFDRHYGRLAAGAAALRIPAPASGELRKIAGRVAALNGIEEGSVRITLTRGSGGSGLRTRGAGPPTLLVTGQPIAPERLERAERGWSVIIARNPRSPVGLPASIKSANRLDAIMARLEADEAEADEAILLSAEGEVAEGTACNVFWALGGRLCTPALGVGILPGVTREVVLEVAGRIGLPVQEGAWRAEALGEASEIFLTMTSLGPVGVRHIDGRALPDAEDAVFPHIREAYWSLVREECAEDPIESGDPDPPA